MSVESAFNPIVIICPHRPHLTLTEYCPLTIQSDIFDDGEKPGLCGFETDER
jgi:hypothetical protein